MNFPKTSGQCKYMLALRSNKPIVVCTGPAGSGKTMLACQVAVEQINKGKVILTRPIVAADEDMGYLPGDLNEKMEPWTRCFFDIFEKYLTHNPNKKDTGHCLKKRRGTFPRMEQARPYHGRRI